LKLLLNIGQAKESKKEKVPLKRMEQVKWKKTIHLTHSFNEEKRKGGQRKKKN